MDQAQAATKATTALTCWKCGEESLKEAASAVVQYVGSVESVMLDGNWIIAPGAEPQPLATNQ